MTKSNATLQYGRSCHVPMVCSIRILLVAYRFASFVQSFVFLEGLDIFARDCDVELQTRRHYRGILIRCQKAQLLAITPLASLQSLCEAQRWWEERKRFIMLCVPTHKVFENHFGYILKHAFHQDFVWPTAMSAFVACSFISSFKLASDHLNTSFHAGSRLLALEKGAIVSFPSLLRGYFGQYVVVELLRDSRYFWILGYLGFSHDGEVD